MRRSSDHRGKSVLTSFWAGLTIIVVTWWLLLGGTLIWVLPEQAAIAAPTLPTAVAVGAIVRISQPDSQPFPIARDRAGFDAMRMGAAAQDENPITRGFATFAWVDVEDGQEARVIEVDGDAVRIEILDGDHAGEYSWIHRSLLVLK